MAKLYNGNDSTEYRTNITHTVTRISHSHWAAIRTQQLTLSLDVRKRESLWKPLFTNALYRLNNSNNFSTYFSGSCPTAHHHTMDWLYIASNDWLLWWCRHMLPCQQGHLEWCETQGYFSSGWHLHQLRSSDETFDRALDTTDRRRNDVWGWKKLLYVCHLLSVSLWAIIVGHSTRIWSLKSVTSTSTAHWWSCYRTKQGKMNVL